MKPVSHTIGKLDSSYILNHDEAGRTTPSGLPRALPSATTPETEASCAHIE